ncbi:MAG: YhjD/YihY/BrkB family envelope integrity protein, partial [Dehalococcoidia bacterium]
MAQPTPILRLSAAQWRVPLQVLGRAVTNFIEHSGNQMAAAISYYALFSLFPLTLLVMSIFGVVLRDPGIREQVLAGIIAFLPIQDQSIAASLRNVAALGPTLTVVSALGSLWSAGALS